MIKKAAKKETRVTRHHRIRRKVRGTAEKPRLAFFKSLKQFYAQIIDDERQHTLLSVSTLEEGLKRGKGESPDAVAKRLGEELARRALEKGISQVVFDRGGFLFHGNVKAFADRAREKGLHF